MLSERESADFGLEEVTVEYVKIVFPWEVRKGSYISLFNSRETIKKNLLKSFEHNIKHSIKF